MTTLKHSSPGTTTTLLTTELDGLASEDQVISGVISNDAPGELDLYADFEWYCPWSPSRGFNDARVELYILIELDGTNYSTGSDSRAPSKERRVGTFYLGPFTQEHKYLHIRRVKLPPTDFKIIIRNYSTGNLAASGNHVKMAKYNLAAG